MQHYACAQWLFDPVDTRFMCEHFSYSLQYSGYKLYNVSTCTIKNTNAIIQLMRKYCIEVSAINCIQNGYIVASSYSWCSQMYKVALGRTRKLQILARTDWLSSCSNTFFCVFLCLVTSVCYRVLRFDNNIYIYMCVCVCVSCLQSCMWLSIGLYAAMDNVYIYTYMILIKIYIVLQIHMSTVLGCKCLRGGVVKWFMWAWAG